MSVRGVAEATQQSRNLARNRTITQPCLQQSRNLATQQSRNLATQQSRNLATQQSRNLASEGLLFGSQWAERLKESRHTRADTRDTRHENRHTRRSRGNATIAQACTQQNNHATLHATEQLRNLATQQSRNLQRNNHATLHHNNNATLKHINHATSEGLLFGFDPV
jgi:hypothetical protein